MGIKSLNALNLKRKTNSTDNITITGDWTKENPLIVLQMMELNNLLRNQEDESGGFLRTPMDPVMTTLLLQSGISKLITLKLGKELKGFLLYLDLNAAAGLMESPEMEILFDKYPDLLSYRGFFLEKIALHPDIQGKGYGRKIIEELEDKNPDYIASSVVVAPQENTASLNFHKKLGFKEIGDTDSEQENGHDYYDSARVFIKWLNGR